MSYERQMRKVEVEDKVHYGRRCGLQEAVGDASYPRLTAPQTRSLWGKVRARFHLDLVGALYSDTHRKCNANYDV
jgi:hypothetical protein